jgi:Uma2 family endonuclease
MHMSTVPKALLTEAEYLIRERRATYKSEFYCGETFAMAGASREHNLIAANISRSLGNQLADRPCEVYQSDMKVRIAATSLVTYPDVVVACGELLFADNARDVLLNPTVVAEVLSPATAAYDCGPKAVHYRRCASLKEFLLVDQHVPYVEHYIRDDESEWRIKTYDGLEAVIGMRSIACHLSLADAYAKVQFEAGAQPLLRPIKRTDA